MAKVYYPKKTSVKLAEGLLAGLVGGLVSLAIRTAGDFLEPERSWWTSISQIGGIFTGAREFNTASPDMGSLLLGLLIGLAFFGLLGLGLPNYLPIFRKFNIHPAIGGAVYGFIIWLLLDLLFLNGITGGRMNLIAALVGNVVGGAVMMWVLKMLADRPTSAPG